MQDQLRDNLPAPDHLIPPHWIETLGQPRIIRGQICALQDYLYSTGVLVGLMFDIDQTCEYRARYCYEHHADAERALLTWDGTGDPSGPWIKEKLSGRLGPGATASRFVFVGTRGPGGCRVQISHLDGGHLTDLDPRNDLINHSPDGFEWGYSGSGPAQLALAMCAAVLPAHLVTTVYQGVKDELIASIDTDSWRITDQQVLDAAMRVMRRQRYMIGGHADDQA